MKKLYFLTASLLYFGMGAIEAQYTILHHFNDTTGGNPQGSLIISDKMLYGMTTFGGTHDSGCIFSLDTNGNNYKDLYDLGGTKGAHPDGSLTLSGSTLYGMTYNGGTHTYGCIFSIDTNGSNYKDLYNFKAYPTDGDYPEGSLTLDGNVLFGMTSGGSSLNDGTIFSIHTDGSGYKVILKFAGSNIPYGESPYGDLTLLGNKLYGMTEGGGLSGNGVIFSVDTNGSQYKTLLQFSGANGAFPWGGLITSGNHLFGMTELGGANDSGCIFSIDTNGSGYKDLVDLNKEKGFRPNGTLLLSGNVMYGLTQRGGLNDYGVFFSADTNDNGYTNIIDFNKTSYPAGEYPNGSVTLSGNNFYGMADFGGFDGDGVVFSFKDTDITTSVNKSKPIVNFINTFPNPSTGIFTIALVGARNFVPTTIEIYNVLGEKVFTEIRQPANDNLINLIGQPNGIYLYRVLNADGGLLGEGKLVIQK